MASPSPRWTYPLIGLTLGIGAPLGEFLLRYAMNADVQLHPAIELATNRFFYLYDLIGTCVVFAAAGVVAGAYVERLRKAEAFYEDLSEHDPLTGLYNARAFRNRCDRAVDRSKRLKEPVSLLLLDVDYLKNVNDEFGHTVGNAVLVHVAEALRAAKRAADAAARWGGDEFAILLEFGGRNAARRVAEELRDWLHRAPLVVEGDTIPVSVTIGICVAVGLATTDEAFAAADRALYVGKHAGRDHISVIEVGIPALDETSLTGNAGSA